MKLFWSSRSPYVRKVLIVAHETGAIDQIELERVFVTVTQLNQELVKLNPLGQVPTLVTDQGEVLYDSAVICRYLDTVFGDGALHPRGAGELSVLRLQALADGLIWLLLSLLGERMRRQPQQSQQRITTIKQKLPGIFASLEAQTPAMGAARFDIGQVGVVAALAYLDFRHPEEGAWRDRYPALADWFATMSERPSVAATTYFDELAAARAQPKETTG